MARLTATVVLPTPPLPLATAMRFLTPGMEDLSGILVGYDDSRAAARRQGRDAFLREAGNTLE